MHTAASSAENQLEPFEARPAIVLHHQIKEDLYLHLRWGRWAPGFKVPSEEALCRHYGVIELR